MTGNPLLLRRDGEWNDDHQCIISTWRDAGRNLVGHIFHWPEDNHAAIVYYRATIGKAVTIKIHVTTTEYIDDPHYVSGVRLGTLPDPTSDFTVTTKTIQLSQLGR